MSIFDLLRMGLENLWRTKLRTILTILGVVVGVGALTSMVSFGTGMQKNITDAFTKNDLFTSLRVTSQKIDLNSIANAEIDSLKKSITSEATVLNDSVVEMIQKIPKVSVVFPEISIPVRAKFNGNEKKINVRVIPKEMEIYYPFNQLLAGRFFNSNSEKGVVVNKTLLEDLGIDFSKADSLKDLGKDIYEEILRDSIEVIGVTFDASKFNPMFALFGKGKLPLADSSNVFSIIGIVNNAKNDFSTDRFSGDIFIGPKEGRKIPTIGFSNVWDILGKVNQAGGYGSIYVRFDDLPDLKPVKEAIEEMGYNTFAFSEELKEVKKAFLILDSLLGAVGFIALFVATLGIINTMVMSILERTREIGIMKSIGGSEKEIRTIFFAEAGTIGFLGSILGLGVGWLVTRIAQKILDAKLIPEDLSQVEIFYFPLWLIFGAIAFAILLSLAAGLYPASRAARIDPVKALRHD